MLLSVVLLNTVCVLRGTCLTAMVTYKSYCAAQCFVHYTGLYKTVGKKSHAASAVGYLIRLSPLEEENKTAHCM